MALFIDLHLNVQGATARDIEDAHRADLRLQAGHGVLFRRYWFDEARQALLCLVEAPDADAARAVHGESHGLVPDLVFHVLEGPARAEGARRGGDPVTPPPVRSWRTTRRREQGGRT